MVRPTGSLPVSGARQRKGRSRFCRIRIALPKSAAEPKSTNNIRGNRTKRKWVCGMLSFALTQSRASACEPLSRYFRVHHPRFLTVCAPTPPENTQGSGNRNREIDPDHARYFGASKDRE